MFKISIKKSRLWIPALGVVIAYGFFHNCVIAPHYGTIVDWNQLILAFSIVIGLGGARDIVLRRFCYLGEVENSVKKSPITNKLWIPFIGWCLVGGFANNFILVPYTGWDQVDWYGLMATLSIMLTISGVRDYGIYAQERKNVEKDPLELNKDVPEIEETIPAPDEAEEDVENELPEGDALVPNKKKKRQSKKQNTTAFENSPEL